MLALRGGCIVRYNLLDGSFFNRRSKHCSNVDLCTGLKGVMETNSIPNTTSSIHTGEARACEYCAHHNKSNSQGIINIAFTTTWRCDARSWFRVQPWHWQVGIEHDIGRGLLRHGHVHTMGTCPNHYQLQNSAAIDQHVRRLLQHNNHPYPTFAHGRLSATHKNQGFYWGGPLEPPSASNLHTPSLAHRATPQQQKKENGPVHNFSADNN